MRNCYVAVANILSEFDNFRKVTYTFRLTLIRFGGSMHAFVHDLKKMHLARSTLSEIKFKYTKAYAFLQIKMHVFFESVNERVHAFTKAYSGYSDFIQSTHF